MATRLNPADEGPQTITFQLGNTEFTVTGVITDLTIDGPWLEHVEYGGFGRMSRPNVELKLYGCIVTQRQIHAEPHFKDRARHAGPVCQCKCDRCFDIRCICPGCECSSQRGS